MSRFRIAASLAFFLSLPSVAFAVPPAAPTNLAVSSEMAGELNLAWEDNATDESHYIIQFRVRPSTTWDRVPGNYPPDTEDAFLTGGNPGTHFEFQVVAYNAANEFSASNIASIVALDRVTSLNFALLTTATGFSHQVTATAARGSAIASYSASGLPDGVSIDADTGLVTGFPTVDGLFSAFVFVHYADPLLPPARGRLLLRIPPVPVAPRVIDGLAPLFVSAGTTPTTVPVETRFEDPDTRDAVRFDTNHGAITVSLFDRAVPTAVENFLHYVEAGAYTDNLFHRSVNAANFDIIQSGTYVVNGAVLNTRPTQPPIVNAPGIANDRGTLALSRSQVLNSATSGWYFNVQDSPGLDDLAGGGYTVFGRATVASLPVLDTLFAFPTVATSFVVDGGLSSGPFATVPTTDGNQPSGSNLLIVERIVRIPALTYTLDANSNPAVASASLMDGNLALTPLVAGTTDLQITATDIDGNFFNGTVPVTVLDNYAHWSSLHANGETADVDGEPDGVNNALEYAFDGDPMLADAATLLPTGGTVESGGSPHLTITFTHLGFAGDLTYFVEKSSDFLGWTTVWETDDGFEDDDVLQALDQGGKRRVTVRDPSPITPGSQSHLRVRVAISAP